MPRAASRAPRAANAATSNMKNWRGELAWLTSILIGLELCGGLFGVEFAQGVEDGAGQGGGRQAWCG